MAISEDLKHLLKDIYKHLEAGDFATFFSRIDHLMSETRDAETAKFLGSVRLGYYRGINALFDDLEAFIGRDYSPLIPTRHDQFDAHASITGLNYGNNYHAAAMKYVNIHNDYSGLRSDSRVLEIGCGAGNFAYALTHVLTSGCYFGIDTSSKNITSCASRFAQHPNYKFHHVAVALDSYHSLLVEERLPGSGAQVKHVRLPLLEEHYSLQVSHSVFTHMYTDEVRNYLKQIYVALAPGGISSNTCFIMDSFAREQVAAGKATHPFVHEKGGFYWYWAHDPLMGNAFDLDLLMSLYDEAGFKVRKPVLYGTWANRNGPFYQDIVVAEKPR